MPKVKTQAFSPYVAEQLKAYVYMLIDPKDDQPFYVGKGRGSRVFAHAADALSRDELDPTINAKLERIREIHRRGVEVRTIVVRHGLDDNTAFEIEAVLIEHLGLTDLLKNLVSGHGQERGRMSTNDVVALYDAPPAPEFPADVTGVLFRIPVLWYPSMDPADLYEATRGWWVMGERCRRAQYAFAVNRGVIREVYEAATWRMYQLGDRDFVDNPAAKQRWGFEGHVAGADMDRFRNVSVAHLFKKGASNPVHYVNC